MSDLLSYWLQDSDHLTVISHQLGNLMSEGWFTPDERRVEQVELSASQQGAASHCQGCWTISAVIRLWRGQAVPRCYHPPHSPVPIQCKSIYCSTAGISRYTLKLFCLSNKWPYDLPKIFENSLWESHSCRANTKGKKGKKNKVWGQLHGSPLVAALYFTFLGVCIAKLLAAHVSSFWKWWQLLPRRPGSNRNQTEALRREKTPNATIFPLLCLHW